MRRPNLLRSLALGAMLLSASGAGAQTTVNPGALDQLAPPPTTPQTAKPAHPIKKPPAAKAAPKPKPQSRSETHLAPPTPPPPPPKPPTVPAAPPPAPVLPPPIVVPTRPVAPPPPVPVVADAPGQAAARKDGLRVTFGEGRADMNAGSETAVRALAHQDAQSGQSTYTITAYAAGSADDPSTPRRLSLSRAIAIRSLLITEGIPSARVYVKALGSTPSAEGDAPADRVDIAIAAPAPAPAAPASSPTSPAAPAAPATKTP